MSRVAPGDCAAWFSALANKITFVTVMTAPDERSDVCEMLSAQSDGEIAVKDVCSSDFCVEKIGDLLIWRAE